MPNRGFVRRRINVHVEIDIWDRNTNTKTFTYHVTQRELLSYTFQKTIKNPNATGSVTLLPQYSVSNRNFLNHVKPFDVVRIYEFDRLKFVGIIQSPAASGTMQNNGKPSRSITLQLSGIGSYLSEAKIGVSAFAFSDSEEEPIEAFINAQSTFSEEIAKIVNQRGSLPYQSLVDFVLDTWFTLLEAVGGSTRFRNITDEYFNFQAGVGDFPRPYWPKEWDLYQGNFDDITLWSLLDNLMDTPFNELWFDEGPRKLVINGSVRDLTDERTHLVLRNTPFNGSVSDAGGSIENRFDALPEKVIQDIISYNLNRSMAEVYTQFTTSDPVWDASLIEQVAIGHSVQDTVKFAKYLYRPLSVKLNNIRIPATDETEAENLPSVSQRVRETAETLQRWFRNNDAFLNGVITTHVPQNPDSDYRIGDKIAIIDEEGHFYCESITHVWSYPRSLLTHVGVTRGWDYVRDAPIVLRGDMFERQGGFK